MENLTGRESAWADYREHILVGGLVGTIAFGMFVMWAWLAPLAGAVVATGQILPDGRNLVIEHQSGGSIKRILVKEGDQVEAGQSIVELDSTTLKTELQETLTTYLAEVAKHQRLRAEATDSDSVSRAMFDTFGLAEEFESMHQTQVELFRSQRKLTLRKSEKVRGCVKT